MNSLERNVGHAVTRYNQLRDQFSEFRAKCESECESAVKIQDGITRVELASISLNTRRDGDARLVFEGLDHDVELAFSMIFSGDDRLRALGALNFSKILPDDEREELLTLYFDRHGNVFHGSAINSSDFGLAEHDSVETMLLYVLKAYWKVPDSF